jgi:hypothetical protein
MPKPWEFAVLTLAIYRLCRLAGWDTITEPIRKRLPPAFVEFLSCPFCFGFWLSVAAYIAWRLEPRPTLIVATVLALSGAAGFVATRPDA